MTLHGFRFVSLTLILSVVLPAAFGLQSPPDPPATDPLALPDTTAPPEPPAADTPPAADLKPLPEPSAPELPPVDSVAVTPPSADPLSTPDAKALEVALPPDSPDSPVQQGREIRNRHLIIAWSENGDELRGFSTKLGDWDLLNIDAQLEITPVLGSQVAAVRVGNKLAAFSAEKGWWDVVTLSKDWAGEFQASDEVVTTRDNGHLYTFAAQKGRWTSPTDPEYQSQRQKISANAPSREKQQSFHRWFESLPRYEARGISPQFGPSGFDIVTDRLSLMSRAKAELESKRDREVPVPGAAMGFGPPATSVRSFSTGPGPATAATPAVPGVGGTAAPTLPPANFIPPGPNVVTTVPGMPIAPRIAIARDPQIQQLRSELDAINAEVEQMAAQSPDESLSEDALRPFVEKSFDLRQDLQQLEAQRLRTKLQEIEKALQERQQNRDKLIEQRVKELAEAPKQNVFPAVPFEAPFGWRSPDPFSAPSEAKSGNDAPLDVKPRTVIGQRSLYREAKPNQRSETKPVEVEGKGAAPSSRDHSNIVKDVERRLLEAQQESQSQLDERDRAQQELREVAIALKELRDKQPGANEKKLRELQDVKIRAFQSASEDAYRSLATWNNSWSNYQNRIRVLQSDVELAQKELEIARKRLADSSAASADAKDDAAKALEKASREKIETANKAIEEYEAALQQFRHIETNQPHLNPDAGRKRFDERNGEFRED